MDELITAPVVVSDGEQPTQFHADLETYSSHLFFEFAKEATRVKLKTRKTISLFAFKYSSPAANPPKLKQLSKTS